MPAAEDDQQGPRGLPSSPDALQARGPGRRRADALPKIDCPRCANATSIVTNSRSLIQTQGVKRRRECDNCGCRYTTVELIDRRGGIDCGEWHDSTKDRRNRQAPPERREEIVGDDSAAA